MRLPLAISAVVVLVAAPCGSAQAQYDPPPPPPPDPPSTSLEGSTVTVRDIDSIAAVRRRGFRVYAYCPPGCSLEVRAVLGRRTAGEEVLASPFDPNPYLTVGLNDAAKRSLRGRRRALLRIEARLSTVSDERIFKDSLVVTRAKQRNHPPAFAEPFGFVKKTSIWPGLHGGVTSADTIITLTSPAVDPDGDYLTYRWTVSNGDALDGKGPKLWWRREVDASSVHPGIASVTVSDDRHGSTGAYPIFVGAD